MWLRRQKIMRRIQSSGAQQTPTTKPDAPGDHIRLLPSTANGSSAPGDSALRRQISGQNEYEFGTEASRKSHEQASAPTVGSLGDLDPVRPSEPKTNSSVGGGRQISRLHDVGDDDADRREASNSGSLSHKPESRGLDRFVSISGERNLMDPSRREISSRRQLFERAHLTPENERLIEYNGHSVAQQVGGVDASDKIDSASSGGDLKRRAKVESIDSSPTSSRSFRESLLESFSRLPSDQREEPQSLDESEFEVSDSESTYRSAEFGAETTSSLPAASEQMAPASGAAAVDSEGHKSPRQIASRMDKTKTFAKSQPDLAGTKRPAPVNWCSGEGARIAVPVSARANGAQKSITSGGSRTNPAQINYSRTRGKSNLDRTNTQLGRQPTARATPRGSVRTARPATSGQSLDRSQVQLSKSSSQLSLSLAPMRSRPTSGGRIPTAISYNRLSRSKSSIVGTARSGAFVTQIPTLISQSHALASSASKSSTNLAPKRSKEAGESSKSDSLLASDKSTPRSGANDLDIDHSEDVTAAGAESRPAESESLGAAEPPLSDQRQPPDAAQQVARDDSDGERIREDSTKGLMPRACMPIDRDCSKSLTCVATDLGESSSPPSCKSANEPPMGLVDKTRLAASLSLEAGALTNEIDGDRTAEGQRQQQVCQQCRLFQSKLNILTRDRKQLNEQLSELEEMENDSRLMSQKLGQQLNLVQMQLDACKLELDRSCHNESKLQFQNKRLHLELNHRIDVIQRLQGELSRLQQVASKRQPSVGAPNSQRDLPSSRQNDDASAPKSQSVSEFGAGEQSVSTCGDRESESRTIGDQCDAPTIDAKHDDSRAESHHRSPTASSSASDDGDSAIDVIVVPGNSANAEPNPTLTARGSTGGNGDESKCNRRVTDTQPPAVAAPEEEQQQRPPDQLNKSSMLDNDNNANNNITCEDSAYSKSSASSDGFNSDDGESSSTTSAQHGHDRALPKQRAHRPNLHYAPDAREHPRHAPAEGQREVTCIVAAEDTDRSAASKQSSPSSSSCDESDHHESVSESVSTSQVGAGEQQVSGGDQPAGASVQLSGRQQVMRKRISTARILRGPQVLPSAFVQQVGVDLANGPSNLSLISQARYAQVVTGSGQLGSPSSQEEDCGRAVGNRELDRMKSPIERALEGVDDLESGRADEALRSIVSGSRQSLEDRNSSGSQILTVIGRDRMTPARSQGESTASAKVNTRYDKDLGGDKMSIMMQENLIGQFKQEIANLRMRLAQATTLNDNLVAELRSSNERSRQPNRHYQPAQIHNQHQSKVLLSLAGSASGRHEDRSQQQVAEQQHQLNSGRSPSIIYVNGSQSSSSALNQHQCCACSIKMNAQHQLAPDCAKTKEIADFFHFLLDKLHFHHQRTFELVNECQKLAMSALLASYSHQINLIHHNSVVAAGNRAQQQHLDQQQVPTIGLPSGSGNYPIRPPPRRRNAAHRMLEPNNQDHDLAAPSNLTKSGHSAPHQSRPNTATASATSALQVAKQTLYSLVPIHNNANAKNQSKTAAEVSRQPIRHQQSGEPHLRCQVSITAQVTSANSRPKVNGSCMAEFEPATATFGCENLSATTDELQALPPRGPQFALTVPAQHLAKVKSSLNEEIERHRVYFNGQLLDLVTRQNWCEGLVAEKLKSYKALTGQQQTRQLVSNASDQYGNSLVRNRIQVINVNGCRQDR